MRLLASVVPQLSTREPVRLLASLPNTDRTRDGGLGRELVRLLVHGLVLSSALALGLVLAWELVWASATPTCGPWPSP